jgi:hypothetical protein
MSTRLETGAAGRLDNQMQRAWSATPRRARPGSSSRPGRGVRPQSRPIRGVEFPAASISRPTSARSCVAEPAAATPVRLTERGLAVILLTGLLLLVTAATVIGLTAFRVTSPDYRPYGHSQVAQG